MLDFSDSKEFRLVHHFKIPTVYTWGEEERWKREEIRRNAYVDFPDSSPACKWYAFYIEVKRSSSERPLDIENVPKLIIDAFSVGIIEKDKSTYRKVGLYPDDDLMHVRAFQIEGQVIDSMNEHYRSLDFRKEVNEMQIQNIDKMIRNFRIKRLCDTVFGFNPHDAIIGEWIRWWLSDSFVVRKKKRRIINPAIGMAKYGKRRTFADILFAEETLAGHGYFKIVGVAEVENSENRFLRKLKNLSYYEEITQSKEKRKFPDLQFALLCIKANAEYQNGNVVLDDASLIRKLRRRMREYSRKSHIGWILFLLRYMKHEEDWYMFVVREYVRDSDMFWYNYAFCGSEFFIYYKGKQVKHDSFLMQNRFSKCAQT